MRASPSHRSVPLRFSAGFTVVELIAVIVVLGILSAMALPRLTDRSAFQARGFEDEVFAALRHARALAVASGCEVQVSIAGNGYTLNQQSGCDVGGFTLAVPDPATQAPVYAGTAPAGITLSAVPANFVFTDRGETFAAGVPTNVVLSFGGNANRSVTVFGATGFAQ
ncbi:MAG: type II secretion system protein [Xanthomonadaceae bacterium]|nr:type II secretion system protein [Xanthomonadaceae bacterium]MDP2184697.1 type II secretion system protein [Xanthomonadales bacterium]MDZ4378096.1 type II secretion system protein [Xanthomonadaceae bacterium]